jgi:hypothetical protein
VAMSHDHDCVRTGWWAGGYVDERVGDFVAGGWCARRERRSAVDGLFVTGLGRLLFQQVECQALVVLSRQMHCCVFLIHSNSPPPIPKYRVRIRCFSLSLICVYLDIF